jgi:ankyrin repeat protein
MYLACITSTVAINSADVPIAEALLAHGANPGLKNRAGETALDIARKNKLKRLVRALARKP